MNKSIIKKLVKASGVSAGDLVLVQLWGEDDDISIMHNFAAEVAELGASPIEMQQSRKTNAVKFAALHENAFDEKYFKTLSNFDVVLDVFAYRPVVLGVKLEDAQMMMYSKYMATLFGALQNAKRFVQIRIPSAQNAEDAGLPYEEYNKRMLSAYDVDYDKLQQEAEKHIEELSKNDRLTISTDNDCHLHFNFKGRKWHIDAGDGDIPAGEVYIAPVESDTNGTIYFPKLYAEDWGDYENITLTVESGIVVKTSDDVLNAHFVGLGTSAKTICELGFGINPNITTLCGYTLLDEKALNTVHIAIGANTMFGGNNNANHHMDFVRYYKR